MLQQSPTYSDSFTLPPGGKMLLPFEIESAASSLAVYSVNEQQAQTLSYMLNCLIEEGFHISVRACPSTQQQQASNLIGASQSYEDQISVPAGSLLSAIGIYSFTSDASADAGFRIYLRDAGAQEYFSDDFVHSKVLGGNYAGPANGRATQASQALGLYILPSPISIASPGQINVQIVNLNQVAATIEMAFYFACPNEQFTPVIRAVVEPSTIK